MNNNNNNNNNIMAERGHQQPHHLFSNQGPTTAHVVAVATLLPVGGFLLLLATLTLTGTLLGLAVTFPLFLLFSPILLPTALAVGLAVTGFLTSGAFGITALSAFSWMAKYIRDMTGGGVAISPGRLTEAVKGRARDAAGYVGQRTQDVGQTIKSKAHEGGPPRSTT